MSKEKPSLFLTRKTVSDMVLEFTKMENGDLTCQLDAICVNVGKEKKPLVSKYRQGRLDQWMLL